MAAEFTPQAIRQIMKEIQDCVQSPPEGIAVHPCEDDFSEINAIVEGPEGTPYEGGQFRIKLKLGNDFPQSPPKGFFITKIFHPNVSPKGEICVNTLKKDWNPERGIKHVLLTIKCLLIYPNPESALNEEAGKLLLDRYEDYAKTARLMTSIHASKKLENTENEDAQDENDMNSGNTGTAAGSKKRVVKDSSTQKKQLEKKKSLKRL